MPRDLFCLHRRRDEGGFAMAVTTLVVMVLLIMTIGMMTTAIHLDTATGRDRRWALALSVAEAGIDEAVYRYASTGAAGSQTLAVKGNNVNVTTVVNADNSVTFTAISNVNGIARKVEAVYGSERSFSAAIYSENQVLLKNNGTTYGDVYSNGPILMENNSIVFGDVITATGYVEFENNVAVNFSQDGTGGGNVVSGGYKAGVNQAIMLANGVTIADSLLAQAPSCPGTVTDDTLYNITMAGSVAGNVIARGSVTNVDQGQNRPGGTVSQQTCQPRSALRSLPSYTYHAANYPGITEWSSVAAFNTWAAGQVQITGYHRILETDAVANCTGSLSPATACSKKIQFGNNTAFTGAVAIITNARVMFGQQSRWEIPATNDCPTGTDGQRVCRVEFISMNTTGSSGGTDDAISIPNGWDFAPDTTDAEDIPATVLYAAGQIETNNNFEMSGTIYAKNVDMKNGLNLEYDDRISIVPGFDSVDFERRSWKELPPA